MVIAIVRNGSRMDGYGGRGIVPHVGQAIRTSDIDRNLRKWHATDVDGIVLVVTAGEVDEIAQSQWERTLGGALSQREMTLE